MAEEQKVRGREGEPERRSQREGILILATALAVFLFTLLETRLPQFSDSHSLSTNVIFFLLTNIIIILLVLLVFLVGRNLIKLFYQRSRGLLGSHLRLRLVLAFLTISLFPALLLLFIGVGFMTNSIEKWFTVQVEGSLASSLEVANSFYSHLQENALSYARNLADEIGRAELADSQSRIALKELVNRKQREYHLGRVEVFSALGESLAIVPVEKAPGKEGAERAGRHPDDLQGGGTFPSTEFKTSPSTGLRTGLEQALRGEEVRQVRSAGEADVVRGLVPVMADGQVRGVVVAEYYIPQSVVRQSSQIARAFHEYSQLKYLRQPIKNNYIMTMALVTLVVVFSAIWTGLFLAKRIAVPLQQLAEATREVAQGHWRHRIEGEGKDEIGTLVAAFNRMTGDLQRSHTELEARRRYMEIILANITAGVVSLDRQGIITTINRAAERLLGLSPKETIGQEYQEVFAQPEFSEVRQVVQDLLPLTPKGVTSRGQESKGQLKLERNGQVLSLLITGTPLTDDRGETPGVVCFFEDVTQIVRVERMEAWREVARRIAHEIKNPLTPIQLAAQRLHKRFAPQISEGAEIFEECTQTIGQSVTELKELVNEFSTFARLPTAEHTPQDLNALVQEGLVLFREAHRDIDFAFVSGVGLPPLEIDREGMKRVLVNLLDNAVAACRMVGDRGQGRIEVVTRYLHPQGIVRLEVADNGYGIAPEVKARIFEPYFSTKREGTGLGLAIVASIVADHQAFVRVRDNPPGGSRFIIELPVKRSIRLFGSGTDLSEALDLPTVQQADNGSALYPSGTSVSEPREALGEALVSELREQSLPDGRLVSPGPRGAFREELGRKG